MSNWKPPKGHTLTRHEGYFVNRLGIRQDSMPAEDPMPDGQILVAQFNEDQPFYPDKRTKPGPGFGFEGYSPDATEVPIQGSWVPPVYTLTADDDDTPVTEPATVQPRELTHDEQIAMLEATIEGAKAQLADLKGGPA